METPLLHEPKWKLMTRLEKSGHRIFTQLNSQDASQCALADNSGSTPDTTEDGVLWLDPTRPLSVYQPGGSHDEPLYCTIPLTTVPGERGKTATTCGLAGLTELRRLFPTWRVHIEPAVQELAIALVKLNAVPVEARRLMPGDCINTTTGVRTVVKVFGQTTPMVAVDVEDPAGGPPSFTSTLTFKARDLVRVFAP